MTCNITGNEVEPLDGPTDETITCPDCGQVLVEETLEPVQ